MNTVSGRIQKRQKLFEVSDKTTEQDSEVDTTTNEESNDAFDTPNATSQPPQSQPLSCKLVATLNSTTKVDKYVRLCASLVKLIRSCNSTQKIRLIQLYEQILKLRQVIRWNGIYQTFQQLYCLETTDISKYKMADICFKCFQGFGDILDRIMFALDMIDNHHYQQFYDKIEKLEAKCYFIESMIWLVYYSFTYFRVKDEKQKSIRKSKILKSLLDTITSYSKLESRIFELEVRKVAVLNIISSLIGIFTILY